MLTKIGEEIILQAVKEMVSLMLGGKAWNELHALSFSNTSTQIGEITKNVN